jgi:hypothetical protein
MAPLRLNLLMLLAVCFAPVTFAQSETVAPTFDVSALPSLCPDAQPGYSCSPTLQVTNWAVPPPGIITSFCTGESHVEYCFATDSSENTSCYPSWYNSLPARITIAPPASDGAYAIFSRYRVVCDGSSQTSPWGQGDPAMTLLLPYSPQVTLGSPAGILSGSTLQQMQNINNDVGQWVTYQAYSAAGASLNMTADLCGSTCGSLPGTYVQYTGWIWPVLPAQYGNPT